MVKLKKSGGKAKQQKGIRELIIVFALIVFAAIAIQFAPLYISGAGFTVKSITADRTISSDADLAAANFIVTTTLDGSNGKIVGYLSQEEFESVPNVETTYPLELTTDCVNEYAYYVIQNDYVSVEEITYTREWFCPEGSIRIPPFGSPILPSYCVQKIQTGTKGSFSTVNTYFDVTVKAKSHDEEISGMLSTFTLGGNIQTAVDLFKTNGDYVGQARWVGNLQTGAGIPEPANYIVTTSPSASEWRVRTRSDWDGYLINTASAWNSLMDCRATAGCYESYLEENIADYNGEASYIINSPTVSILGNGEEQEEDPVNGIDAIKVELTENNLVYNFPEVVWYIRAYWLGAYIPVGIPEIISTSDVEIWSGESATLDVAVKNKGTVDASFDATVVSPCSCVQNGIARKTIAAGDTDTITILLNTGVLNQDEIAQCKVRVYATTKPSNYDEAWFSFDMHKARECSPVGSYKGEDSCIFICSADSYWETVLCCDANDEQLVYDPPTDYGGWECASDSPTPPPGTCYVDCCDEKHCGLGVTPTSIICQYECKVTCWFSDNQWYFYLGGVILALLLIIGFIVRKNPYVMVARQASRELRKNA